MSEDSPDNYNPRNQSDLQFATPNPFGTNQERIQNAHQKLKQWNERLVTGNQDRESTDGNGIDTEADHNKPNGGYGEDMEDIQLEMGEPNESTKNQDENLNTSGASQRGRNSIRTQIIVNEQYKQFYGGEEDPRNSTIIENKKEDLGMGAIKGVFLPCVQNILSVVLFLRINLIIGEAGIFQSFAILFFSTSTTFFTVLSMNAIATNGKIRTGGVYYLISRSLGPATGGSIGILYYFASTVAAAMSILGAVEAIHVITGWYLVSLPFSMRFFSFALLAVLISCILFGVRFVSKIGVILITLVFISIFCMVIGLFVSGARSQELQSLVTGLTGLESVNFRNNWSSDYKTNSFFTLHAIFFNACTGILQGANSSNNLRDPINSIPKGTLAAHLSTLVLYIILFLLFGAVGTREALTNLDFIISAEIAWPQRWVVYLGIILSSSGSALQQAQNAPTIINSIADDDMLPRIFNFLKGPTRKPLGFTVFLIAVSICFGSIDQIAPLVTIFYLVCYGGVNIACFLLDYLGSPNWRPKWKYYHKVTSFLGALLCVASMIVISWWASLSAIVGALLIYAYLDKKSQEKNWGDGVEGIRAERARNALLKIDKTKKHVKNWRPHYLALGYINEKGKITSPGIFKLLHQLRKGTGLAIYGCVVKGDYNQDSYAEARKKEVEIDVFMKKNKYNVFSKVVVSQNIEQGMVYLIQSSGLGGLEPNTVLLAWPNQWEDDDLKCNRFVNLINHAHSFGHLITILKPQKEFDTEIKHQGTIDIWSFNFEKGMLLLFVQILIKSSHWKRCTVRLFIMTSLPEKETENMKRVAREYLDRYRLLEQNIFIEVVHVSATMIEQFTQTLNETLEQKYQLYRKAIQEGNIDQQFGALPSFMKLKDLQEKERNAMIASQVKKQNESQSIEQDVEERMLNAKRLNQIILQKSKDASLVITNLPPILKNQPSQEYMNFVHQMTSDLKRVLLIQNSTQEVLTHYN